MKRSAWIEQLNRFKENETPENVLLVAGNGQLTRIVVAWTNTEVSRATRLTKCKGTDDESIWRWLWQNAHYSREDLLTRIPFVDSSTEKKINALIANRVLYPDGSANSFVERYLREIVLKLLGSRSKGNRKAVGQGTVN